MRPLVILRPQPGASATAEAARKLGLEPLVMPLFEILPIEWQAPDAADFAGLLLTSANAVRHAGAGLDSLRNLPAHCVGEATADTAREAGLNVESVGKGGVDALMRSLPRGLRLLHLCGVDRRGPRTDAQSITAVPVYRAVEVPAPEGLRAIQAAVVAVHSPRAGRRLSDLADSETMARESIAIAAISVDAAAAAGRGWATVEAAHEATDSALLALAASLCNKS